VRSVVLRSLLVIIAASGLASAQSSDQLFPTPVRSSEILSIIKARDLGDSRLTTYYYTFEGEQGDVFINVQSRSFTGDIDVFVVPTQTPLTKIVIYADQAETETGRVVYLRKPERLLLRIQGRTPGDDEAVIRIKFAGSFAVSRLNDSSTPEVPRTGSTTESDVRVNSVGTIVEVIPRVKPTPDAVAEREEEKTEPIKSDAEPPPSDRKEAVAEKNEPSENGGKKVEVVVSDPVTEEPKNPRPTRRRPANRRNDARNRTLEKQPVVETEKAPVETPSETARRTAATRRNRTADQPRKEESAKVDPMANVRLVIYFKDGSTIDRPMPEVQRFSVERAILTVIHKNGTIGRYNMADVLRVSIE
jgi:hypothetical protein